MSTAVHLPPASEITEGAADWVGWLDPESELEEIELGQRVSDWLAAFLLAGIYTGPADQEMSTTLVIVQEIASATSWLGLQYPASWWPPSASQADVPEVAR